MISRSRDVAVTLNARWTRHVVSFKYREEKQTNAVFCIGHSVFERSCVSSLNSGTYFAFCFFFFKRTKRYFSEIEA